MRYLAILLATAGLACGQTNGQSTNIQYRYEWVQDGENWGVKVDAESKNPETNALGVRVIAIINGQVEARGHYEPYNGHYTAYLWFGKTGHPVTWGVVIVAVVGYHAIDSKVEQVK